MNKFLKKKAPEALVLNDEPVYSRPSILSSPTSPGVKKGNNSRWRKNKKQPEAKPSIDLACVLPSNDDFRTSLLMPKLSARFSMLREQDDPNSILGKASDDSVLQPRRRSRMLDFGFNTTGLSDIDEVSSLNGSIRPPFAAPFGRQSSYASEDGYGSDADNQAGSSVLSRSRPGEGNNLFGGRQKIYKINTAGASRSLGKAVYEDDVGLSAFQRYRRERMVEHRPSDDSMGFDFGLDNMNVGPEKSSSESLRKERSDSPSLFTHDKKRSTASSSVQSEARSSTAATSITSPSIASAAPSPSLAAAQSAPPASTFERTNPKSRRLYEQGLDQHMQDQQTSALTRLNSLQRQRPGAKQLHSAKSAGNLQERPPQPVYALRTQSPTDHPTSPARTLASAKKLHSNGHSPNPSIPGSPTDSTPREKDVLSRAMDPNDRGKATALGAFNKPQQAFDEQQYLQRQLQLHRSNSNAAAPQQVQNRIGRLEQESQRSSSDTTRAGSDSSTTRKQDPSKATNAPSRSAVAATKAALLDTHRTFFGDIKASESEDEEESQNAHAFSPPDYGYGLYHGKWQPTALPSVSEHPALRAQKSKSNVTDGVGRMEPAPLRTKPLTNPLVDTFIKAGSLAEGVDSPTLGIGHQPLNGMVHHLRQRSNQSSIYPMDDTVADDDAGQSVWNPNKAAASDALDDMSRHDSTYTTSNPWDSEDHEHGSVTEHGHTGHQDDGLGDFAESLPWQQELRRQHNREASNATQQERDAFANELASRRTAIQQSIKKQVEQREAQSRGSSPARSVSGPFKALGMMRTKSSREALAMSREGSRSQKNLVMAIGNQSSTSIASQSDRPGQSVDISRSHTDSPPVPPIPNNAQHPAFQQSNSRDWEASRQHPATRSMASSRESHGRSRSNSTTTNGRSRSRTGPYRDDLERAMIEGTGSSTSTSLDNGVTYGLPRELTPRPSPDVILNSTDGGKPGMSNYFEPKHALTLQTSSNSRLHVQGTSPAGHSPNNVSPMMPARPTPPVSSTSTPAVSPGIVFPSRPPTISRRKTISKSDISTPKLISTTYDIDTVDLPEGASLMNGADDPPPIPPINPRRRGGRKFFGIGRQGSSEERPTTSSDNSHSHASSRELHGNDHPMPIYNGYGHSSSPEHEGNMI